MNAAKKMAPATAKDPQYLRDTEYTPLFSITFNLSSVNLLAAKPPKIIAENKVIREYSRGTRYCALSSNAGIAAKSGPTSPEVKSLLTTR